MEMPATPNPAATDAAELLLLGASPDVGEGDGPEGTVDGVVDGVGVLLDEPTLTASFWPAEQWEPTVQMK